MLVCIFSADRSQKLIDLRQIYVIIPNDDDDVDFNNFMRYK